MTFPRIDASAPQTLDVSADLRGHLAAGFAFFRGLSLAERDDVARLARASGLPRGGILFRQGEPPTALHLVFDGQLRLSQAEADGSQLLVQLVRPGGACGWMGSPEQVALTATARASDAVRVLSWQRRELEDLFEKHPVLARNALRIMGRRLSQRDDCLRELATERVPQRLARTILRLARPGGRRFEDGLYDDLPLSRLDLAQLCGTTLFTVSRILSDWEGEHIVRAGRQHVVVRDYRRLTELAGPGRGSA